MLQLWPSLSTLMGIFNILLFECLAWVQIISYREQQLMVEIFSNLKLKERETFLVPY
jgi:hypothetical protein